MNKLLIIAPWVVLGVVVAGLYGIANNQVTYTLSPEFYREYKFLSFGVQDIPGSDRLRVAAVGWLASWWVGLVIGVIITLPGIFSFNADIKWLFFLYVAIIFSGCFLGGLGAYLWSNYGNVPFVLLSLNKGHLYNHVGFIHVGVYVGAAFGLIVAFIHAMELAVKMHHDFHDSNK